MSKSICSVCQTKYIWNANTVHVYWTNFMTYVILFVIYCWGSESYGIFKTESMNVLISRWCYGPEQCSSEILFMSTNCTGKRNKFMWYRNSLSDFPHFLENIFFGYSNLNVLHYFLFTDCWLLVLVLMLVLVMDFFVRLLNCSK